jgi:hypothetical protein
MGNLLESRLRLWLEPDAVGSGTDILVVDHADKASENQSFH